jgi:2-polyprenyl-6-methoxyphenol hydroxylase-like FAD-dependent oxidoreductase
MKFDVIIVGARCAGAATALLLARAGARVLVVDKGAYGTDTLSTHALMRGSVVQLHRWGVLPAIVDAGTPPIRTTTFSYTDQEVTVAIEPKFGVDALYAPRRTLLDRVMIDAAADSGADVGYGVTIDDVVRDASGRVRGVTAIEGGRPRRFDADLVVGADGLHSTVARRVGAATLRATDYATGVLFSYWEGLDARGYEWIYRGDGSIGAIPTNGGATCVFVSVPATRFGAEIAGGAPLAYRRMIRAVEPAFDDRLAVARRVEPIRGFGGHCGYIREAGGPGWALVGDAGYFKDPLTAHGITDALRDAELLARAALKGTAAAFADYARARYDLSDRLFEITGEIASFAWTDAQLQALHRALSSEMAREVRALAELEPLPCPLPLASERRGA